MIKLVLSAFVFVTFSCAAQKEGAQEHWSALRTDRLQKLELNVGHDPKRAKCEDKQCLLQTNAMAAAMDKDALRAAVENSCFHLDQNYSRVQCGREQSKVITDKLAEFKSSKKTTYKRRALAAEAKIVRLNRRLLDAQIKLNHIDARLSAYLIRLGEVPNQSIHQKISQIQGKIETLRQQVLDQDRELLARQTRIDDLDADNQRQAAEIANLQAENAQKDQQITDLNRQIDDLDREFGNLVDQSIHLNGIVSDFGLELGQYTAEMQGLTGSIAERMNQLRGILDQQQGDLSAQVGAKQAEYAQKLTEIRREFDQMAADVENIGRDTDRLRAMIGKL